MGAIEVKYFNSFILRKTLDSGDVPVWNGSRGNNTYPKDGVYNVKNWFVEEARIRGGYNNTITDLGAKAYLVEEEPKATFRTNSMIYSGIFNSRTGVNDTNVFSVGEDITRSVDPANGSIQRLYAEDTNLIIFQENKVSRAPIDKDIIYTAEGNPNVTSSNLVIGSVQAYAGNFGISKNPESFAVYGYRKYFTDRDRNAILRLSNDGLTEISNYGMIDFFRDELSQLDNSTNGRGKAVGIWDIYNKQYVLSLQPSNTALPYKTLSYDDGILGWTSLYSYKPNLGVSVKSSFYTFYNGSMYRHYATEDNDGASVPRCRFYGTTSKASVTFVFNPNVSLEKVFKTVGYEGSNGWQVESFVSDVTGVGGPIISDSNSTDTVGYDSSVSTNPPSVWSYNQGSYDNYGNEYPAALIPPIMHAGFDRKENKYVANLLNNSSASQGEVLWGPDMTGVKGYYTTVKMSTDTVTDVGGMKELFAVSSNYVESSY